MQRFHADDGEPIHVAVSGDGPRVIMLPGWTSTHRDWNPFIDRLSATHRVFRWDARGHGGHALHTATVPTLARMARDLAQLIEHWQLDEVTVVGHSMGALTLWQYVLDYGCERLARVVIVDQSPKLVTDEGWALGIYGDFDAARNAAFIGALRADFAEGVLRLIASGHNAAAREAYAANTEAIQTMRARLARMAAQPLIDCWASLTAADLRGALPRLWCPALLVYGGESNFYSAATARYVRDHLPESQLLVYPGVDHAPHLWRRERFAADLTAFLATGLPRRPVL